ncbi:hypothetical protein ACKW6Q_22430, partial [Chryseobacterium kwangjuense]
LYNTFLFNDYGDASNVCEPGNSQCEEARQLNIQLQAYLLSLSPQTSMLSSYLYTFLTIKGYFKFNGGTSFLTERLNLMATWYRNSVNSGMHYTEKDKFVNWGLNVLIQNPNMSLEQFEQWFLTETLSANLQNELFEDWADPNRVKPTTRFKKNQLVNCVYNKAKTAANFNQYLKNFNGKFSTAHLLFDLQALDPANNAETSTPLGYWITITINSNNLNRPTLDIARTFMHEIIHAEMFRILLSLASTSNGQINLTELTNMLNTHNYPGIYDYFRRYELNDMQHEQMAAHYRGIVKNFLKQIDNSLTDEQYEAIAWQGLQGTERWNQLTASQKANINTIYSNWYNTASHNCP